MIYLRNNFILKQKFAYYSKCLGYLQLLLAYELLIKINAEPEIIKEENYTELKSLTRLLNNFGVNGKSGRPKKAK